MLYQTVAQYDPWKSPTRDWPAHADIADVDARAAARIEKILEAHGRSLGSSLRLRTAQERVPFDLARLGSSFHLRASVVLNMSEGIAARGMLEQVRLATALLS